MNEFATDSAGSPTEPGLVLGVDIATENLLNWVTTIVSNDDFAAAKKNFSDKYGKVFPEDEMYDAWMDYFANIFMFERRPVVFAGQTPFEAWRLQHVYHSRFASSDLYRSVSGLNGFVHSLFEITKVDQFRVNVYDLCRRQNLLVSVRDQERTDGLCKGEIFQGFLYYFEDDLYLGRGLLMHPREVSALVRSHVLRSAKYDEKTTQETLVALAHIYLRHVRHTHVAAGQIYRTRLESIAAPT